jgi:pSer/pThr/pTyr-binding forkhead associated (FHA) protein
MSSQNSEVPIGTTTSAPRIGLAEILQICCVGRRNGQITFKARNNEGFVFVQHGQVLHASAVGLEGDEAVFQMLSWEGGSYTFEDEALPKRRTVRLTWEQLLVEGARRVDEGIHSVLPQVDESGHFAQQPQQPGVDSSGLANGQPKLRITMPNMEPYSHDLVNEFTRVGRIEGNEVVIPIPSVSSHHCIFIFSGTDVVVRDLNSANSTMVNGEAITEKILQVGDLIYVGEAEIRFESTIKRPQLRAINKSGDPTTSAPTPVPSRGSAADDLKSLSKTTVLKRPVVKSEPRPSVVDNKKFLKGGAIRIDALQEQEKPKTSILPFILIAVAAVIIVSLFLTVYLTHHHR